MNDFEEESGSPKVVDAPMPSSPSPSPSPLGSPESRHALSFEDSDTASGTESEGSPISPASTFSLLEDDSNREHPKPGEEPQFRGRRNEAAEQKQWTAPVQGVIIIGPAALLEHEAEAEIIAHEAIPPHAPAGPE